MSETNETVPQDLEPETPDPNAAPQPAATEASPGQEQADPPEPQGDEPKSKQPQWVQRRIDELTRARYDERRRADDAEARLRQLQPDQSQNSQAIPPGYIPVQDVQRFVAEQASTAQYNRACDAIADAGAMVAAFDEGLGNLRALGVNPSNRADPLMQVLTELDADEGARAIASLGANPDEAYRILNLSPARMAVEVAKMAAKPARSSVSRAPSPITPLNGGAAKGGDPYTMNDEDQRKWFIANDPRRRNG